MESDEVIRKLEPWLAKHRRPAWKPIVEDGDGSETSSKFCGTPWIGPNAPWPDCGRCRKPLQLFLQLDLANLPQELGQRFGTGLLQLFYCTRDECQGSGGWEPFGEDLSRVRVVQPRGTGRANSLPREKDWFPPQRIVGWERFIDLPDPSEHEELGLKHIYRFQDFESGTSFEQARARLECPELGLVLNDLQDEQLGEGIATRQFGDKLGGWPHWIQGVEYPACPRCEGRMTYVFQLDSEDNVPFMFGDSGCGHITQCPDHKDVVAFGWACC
jgi:uncharacterized protein YwqG